MKLLILGCGTSTGVPVPGCDCQVCNSPNPRNKRCRTSALLKLDDGRNILIDASTDLRHQALAHGVKRVDAVLYTHAHADHILGTDDLRCFNFVLKKAMPCYGTVQTLEGVKRCFPYIFDPDPDYQGGELAKLDLNVITHLKPFQACDLNVMPFELAHGRMSVTGFRFGEIGYATDFHFMPEESRAALKGVKYLVLDGLRYESHRTHITIPQAIDLAKEIGAQQTYLVHMTHTVEYDEVSAKLPAGVALAYDGLEIG